MNNYLQILGDLSGLENLEYVFAGLISIIIFIFIFAIIVLIIMVISQWKIFKKAGEEGWKAIIPYYNTYTLCKLVGVNPYWILIVLIGSLLTSVPIIGLVSSVAAIYFTVLKNVSLAKSFGKDTGFAVGLILLPVVFYPVLAFGKDEYTGANPMEDIIFKNKNNSNSQAPNVAQSNAVNNQVPNAQPMNSTNPTVQNQPVQNQPAQPTNTVVNPQAEILDDNTATVQPQAQQAAYCTNCGNPLSSDDLFCTNCGTKRN